MIEDRRINAEFEGLSHGINPERIIDSTGYPMMICPMCEQILWNPQMCSDPDCGCTLCERCLKRAVEERETCEDCLQTTKYDPNPFFVKSFKNLTFRCHNNKRETFLGYSGPPQIYGLPVGIRPPAEAAKR